MGRGVCGEPHRPVLQSLPTVSSWTADITSEGTNPALLGNNTWAVFRCHQSWLRTRCPLPPGQSFFILPQSPPLPVVFPSLGLLSSFTHLPNPSPTNPLLPLGALKTATPALGAYNGQHLSTHSSTGFFLPVGGKQCYIHFTDEKASTQEG